MKKLTFIAVFLLLCIAMFRCSKTPGSVETTNKTSGSYVFYTRSDLKMGKIDVYIDDVRMGQITQYYTKAPITCNAGISLTVEQTPGTHKFRAVSETGIKWTADIDFVAGQCANYELTELNTDTSGVLCLTTLYGTWHIVNEPANRGLEGMTIKFENGKGVITYVKQDNFSGYKIGDVMWKDYYSEDCMVNYLTSPSLKRSDYTTVKFYGHDHMRIGTKEYVRE